MKENRSRCYTLWIYLLFILIIGIAGNGMLLAGVSDKAQIKPYNVILITIDTLRADHLGCYGYRDIKTPAIDTLASGGVLFTRNYTPVPVTLPSHVTIMTGLYPPSHGVRNNGTSVLGEEVATLAECLKKWDYHTAAFVGAYVLHSRYGLYQGFDIYNDRFPPSTDLALPLYNERPAEEVIDLAMKWLEEKRENRFFLWIHLFDPHAPYAPPEPLRETYKLNPYDGEIVYVDTQLSRLLEGLKPLGLEENTLLVFTADHGEGLDEHGEKTHAVFVYDSTLQVPLIFRLPGILPAGNRIQEMVCTIDIMPTILDILKISVPDNLQGHSLCGLISGNMKVIDRDLYCESHYPELNFGWSRLEGIRTKKWKYIEAPKSELYRIDRDPKELTNLIAQERTVAGDLKDKLHRLKEGLSVKEGDSPALTVSLDTETRQRLQSLGYVWTQQQPESEKMDQLPDPKDMIKTLEALDVAMFYSMLGLYKKAIQYLESVVQTNPANFKAQFYLASNYEKAGEYDKAIMAYQKVISMDPDYSEAHNSLGAVYEKKGSLDLALEQLVLAEKLSGNYMEVYHNLGLVYDKRGDYDKALQYLLKAVEFVPDHPSVRNNLGGVYLKLGRIDDAIKEFQRVVDLEPEKVEAYNNLGIAYRILGDYERAEASFRQAIGVNADYAISYSNLAGFYIMTKHYNEAVGMAKQAIDRDDQWSEAYMNLGIAYFYLHQYKEAINHLQRAVSIDSNQPEGFLTLGLCHFFLKDFEKAKHYYEKTLEIDPENIKGLINLGTILFKEDKTKEAIAAWEEALELDYDSIEAYINLASAYFRLNEYDQAITKWKQVVEMDANHVNAYLNLGNCYYQMGLLNLAIREWLKTVGLDNTSIAAHINLASAYYQQGRLDLALSEWQKVDSLDPSNPDAAYNQGLIHLNRGNYDLGVTYLSRALSLKPTYSEAHALLEQVRLMNKNSTEVVNE